MCAEADQLREALVHRLTIGQAQGILMERLGITADQAFAFLRRVSNATNVKLHAVAAQVVETRTLPNLQEQHPSESLKSSGSSDSVSSR